MKDYLSLITLVFSSFCFSYGQGAKIYDQSNSDIVSDNLLSVAIDDKGNKWIGTSGFGLLKFDGKKFISFNGKNSGIKGRYVSPVFKDSRGNIWASFSEPGDVLGKYDGNGWTVYTAKDLNVDEISVISICEDTQGAIYVGGSGGVFVFQNEAWSRLSLPDSSTIVRSMDIDNTGALAIGHNNGLLIRKNEQWQVFTKENSELRLGTVRGVKFKANGELLVGYGGGFGDGGFSVISEGKWTHYNKTNSGISDHMVRDIEFDGIHYWMATNNGLIKFDGTNILPVFFREGMYRNAILDIAIDNGTVWVATNFGLIEYKP